MPHTPSDFPGHHFADSAALLQQCRELLAEPIALAAQQVLQALMNDGKVLTCGCGHGALLADALCRHLVQGLSRPRMALAALSLAGNPALLTQPPADEVFARQIHALGKQHDLLWLVAGDGNETALLAAARAARERGLRIILLSGNQGGEMAALLDNDDVWLNVPHPHPQRIIEAQTVVLHACCDYIDHLLLGLI